MLVMPPEKKSRTKDQKDNKPAKTGTMLPRALRRVSGLWSPWHGW